MGSRIESAECCEDFFPSRRVMPSNEVWIVDLNPDDETSIYSISCNADNSFTLVSEVYDPRFLDTGERGEDTRYFTIALLEEGDPCYLMDCYSPDLEKVVQLRILHE